MSRRKPRRITGAWIDEAATIPRAFWDARKPKPQHSEEHAERERQIQEGRRLMNEEARCPKQES